MIKAKQQQNPFWDKVISIIIFFSVILVIGAMANCSKKIQDEYMLEPICKYDNQEGTHSDQLVKAYKLTYFDCEFFKPQAE